MTTAKDHAFAEMIKETCIDEIKIASSSLDEAIEWIKNNLDPEEVFDEDQLGKWAEYNGYKKEEV